MDGIITVDEQQNIILYNQAAEKIFGWSGEQVMGRSLDMLIPERFRAGHREHIRRFAATGVTSRRMGDSTVIRGLRSSGEEFPMDASISQLDTAEGKLLTVILRDVTERVRAQEDLAAFATEANAIREQEKSRVARELHDELAQSLTALKMDTIWVRENLGGDPQAVERKLADMLAMLDASVAATRRIAADLRPLLLDDLGLDAGHRVAGAELRATHRHPVRTGCGRGAGAARTLCDGRVSHRAGVAGERGKAFEGHAGQRRHRAQRKAHAAQRAGQRRRVLARTPPASRIRWALRACASAPSCSRVRSAFDSQPGEGTTVEARIPVGEPGELD